MNALTSTLTAQKPSMQKPLLGLTLSVLLSTLLISETAQAASANARLEQEVDKQAKQLMSQYQIPGMAFGIIIDGKSHFITMAYLTSSATSLCQSTQFLSWVL